jgi:AraC-like DNA-binding protein
MISEKSLQESILRNFAKLREPANKRAGTLPLSIGIPENIVVMRRDKDNRTAYDDRSKYHPRHVLLVNIQTPGSVILNNTRYHFAPGQFMMIFPYQVHHYTDFKTKEIFWLHITFDLSHAGDLAALRNTPPVDMNKRALAALNRIMACMLSAGRKARNNELVFNTALLVNELLFLHKKAVAPGMQVDEGLFEKVGRYVDNHLADGVRIAGVARHIGCSESHLRAVFRKRTGISLGKYMELSRMARAHKLVDMTDMNVSQIAYDCGYESPAAFSRLFKKHIGQTPREHRKMKTVP